MLKALTVGLTALALSLVIPSALAASAAGIRGQIGDGTCASGCLPTCPSPPGCEGGVLCPQGLAPALIACPLDPSAQRQLCPTAGCGPILTPPPPYTGPGAHLIVHRLGSPLLIARREPSDGHFSVVLAPGHYAVKAYVTLACWSGETQRATVVGGRFTELALRVEDHCLAHPEGGASG